MTDRPPADTRTVGGLLASKAVEPGGTPFVRYGDRTYSHADLDERANSVANALWEHGVTPGDVVPVCLYNRPEYLDVIFGIAKLGAVIAPVDTRYTGDHLAHVLSETDGEIVVVDDETEPAYAAVRDRVPTVTTEFFVGDDTPQSYRDFDDLLAGDPDPPDVDVDGADPFSVNYVQQYNTERPTGVRLPHYAYVNTGWEVAHDVLDLSADDCVFTTQPLYGSFPVQAGLVSALVADAEFAFEKQFERDRFWEWTCGHEATVFLYLGRTLSVLYNRRDAPDDVTVEYAFGNGFGYDTDDDLIAEFERRFDVTVLETYGTTATASVTTANSSTDRRLGSTGRALPDVTVEIVDEDDWILPPGETGEIVVRPDRPNTMMQGIAGDPELAERLGRNQWIHTNDIGYKDEDGYLYFVANRTNSIRVGRVGGRISSLEIESVIDAHPDVKESTVLGVPTDDGDEDIKAVVVPEADATVTPIDISEHCERQLTYRKLPRYVEFREELPRSPAGKVRKTDLRTTGTPPEVWDRESGYSLNR